MPSGAQRALLCEAHSCIASAQVHVYAVLPPRLSSNTFISLCPLPSHTSEQPHPAVPFLSILLQTHPGAAAGSGLSPPRCRRLEQWLCRGGTTMTPAHPPLPKQHGWEQGMLLRLGTWHGTSLWEPWGWQTHRAPHPGWDPSSRMAKQGFIQM